MDSVLEELKSSTRDSLFSKQQALSELAKESKQDVFGQEEFRDAILDILSQVRTEYQLTVAEAKGIDDLAQIAELWKETRDFYSAMLTMWKGMNALLEEPKDKLFVYWGELIEKLARASDEQYQFHGRE